MQHMDWDDLRYLLAVLRGGGLLGAARLCGVDKTTVSRRLAALEKGLGVKLVERSGGGRMTLTDAGRKVAARAEAMEDQTRGIASDLGRVQGAMGQVRLTAVPILVNHLLLPRLPELTRQMPGLLVELVADVRDLSLTERDADIAIRLARPRVGGQGVTTRKLGALDYGCFAASGVGAGIPWIGYEPPMAYLDHAQAIERLCAARGERLAAVLVNDAETLLQAVAAGQGKSLLPRRVARAFGGLVEIPLPEKDLPVRDIWLMVHRDVRHLERVVGVVDWLKVVLTA